MNTFLKFDPHANFSRIALLLWHNSTRHYGKCSTGGLGKSRASIASESAAFEFSIALKRQSLLMRKNYLNEMFPHAAKFRPEM